MMSSNPFSNLPQDPQEDEDLIDEVVLWLVKMSSDDCTEQDRLAFEHWQNQDLKRIELVKEYQVTLNYFSKLKQQNQAKTVVSTLEQSFLQTKQSLWHLRSFFALIGLGLLLLTWYSLPTQEWMADTKNEYNQWTEQVLSDQSEIKISGTTAYDIVFDKNKRLIQLYNGNILVHVAKDARRPFIIETKYARITALGTRFIVHHNKNSTILTMLESKTKVEPLKHTTKNAQQYRVIEAGQQIIIYSDGIIKYTDVSPELYEAAWQQKMLIVQNMALPEVLDVLQNYQVDKMTFNAQELEDIRVTATLPLDHSALSLLTHSVAIQEGTSLWGQQKIYRINNKKE